MIYADLKRINTTGYNKLIKTNSHYTIMPQGYNSIIFN